MLIVILAVVMVIVAILFECSYNSKESFAGLRSSSSSSKYVSKTEMILLMKKVKKQLKMMMDRIDKIDDVDARVKVIEKDMNQEFD